MSKTVLLWGLVLIIVYNVLAVAVDLVTGLGEYTKHLSALPLVIASSAPYVSLAAIITLISWELGDWFFSHHNEDMVCAVGGESCRRGLAHELVHDNNLAAASFVLAPPMLWTGILIFYAIITRAT